uniref:Uncharacterized protein n=1 Tax=Cucumis melo TaxID=3656 RepID=A0A9I9DRT9_CUCME
MTKLVKIQTTKEKKQEMLADLSGQVKSVVVRNKAAKMQKVDCLEIVVKEFDKEIEKMSHLEPKPQLKEQGLVYVA